MKCIGCSMDIPPAFVAAIRENRCPGCGTPCMEQNDHNSLFHIVAQIKAASPDLVEDMCVRVASVLHGSFDIFPKGVVVDGYLTKEIQYVEVAVMDPYAAHPARRPVVRSDGPPIDYDHNDPQEARYAATRSHEGRQAHYNKVRSNVQRQAQDEAPGEGAMRALEQLRSRQNYPSTGEDFSGEDVSVRDIQDLEATRRAEDRVRQIQAQNAGIGRKR